MSSKILKNKHGIRIKKEIIPKSRLSFLDWNIKIWKFKTQKKWK